MSVEKNTKEVTNEMTPIVKPKLDVIFKMIFGNPENDDILRAFLSAVFRVPKEAIGDIEFENVEIPPEKYGDKYIRLDVKVRINGKKINIEMQICYDEDYAKRILYYWSKMFTSDFKSGTAYGDLTDSVSINILSFNMFECEEYHSHFQILETTRHEKFSDSLSFHFFELKKAVKADEDSEIVKWLKLIDVETEEELTMAENTATVPEIKKAAAIIRHLSADEKVQEEAFQREQALHLEASLIGGAERRGIAQGMAQGIEIGGKLGIQAGKIIMRMMNEGKVEAEIISELKSRLNITEESAYDFLNEYRD